MSRAESFALGSGMLSLGLVAVLVAVFLPHAGLPGAVAPSLSQPTVVEGALAYGWLLVAWMLVRRSVNRDQRRHKSRVRSSAASLSRKVVLTVGGLALLLLPVQYTILALYLPPTHRYFQAGIGRDLMEWTLVIAFFAAASVAVLAVIHYLVLTTLMPVVYGDLRDK